MPADQSHPFATFPATTGKNGNGLRPYYTPGLVTNGNYTVMPDGNPPLTTPYYDDMDDLIDSKVAARELVNFIVLKYLTTAISSPFEVSKTLLQVQYMPREEAEVTSITQTSVESEDEAEHHELSSEEEEEEEEDFYNEHAHRRRRYSADPLNTGTLDVDDPVFKKKVTVDASGYVVRSSVYDDATRPPHQIKPIEGGVWQGIGKLMKQPHEGWRSLFKGQYTNWLYEISHLFLQPTLEGSLNDMFDLYDDTIPLVHLDHVGPNLATLIASNLIVGFILSPLELIRTRMQVQSASPLQRKYKGPFHALKTIIQEEGGIQGLYFSHNTLPTILFHTITPLLQNTTPLIIDRVLNISANESPFLYSLAELGLNTLEILITLPLDTIRKRLQCQIRTRTPGKKRFEPVVATRPVPYTGIANAAYCIIKEEGEKTKKKVSLQKKNILTDWSLRGLYHGFNMQCTSNIVLFFLHAINGIEDDYYEDF
ncbi:mitochondrial carrier domain-containing protein [Gilbertella persicaria]|uniref:mitochondrial carrier domain-containing protein n=1 Tax=Gilbertella persicaria TaxID=101096 RepID=UPI00222126B7|nr:mitochondrial carrier domain-containing protein [Gilbertella persicaria]KAI8071148.1 mitochondrial carrier domain-containing protein [Gilbertella persicaria]